MLNALMQEKNLDGIVIFSRVNRIYFSGFTGTEGMLLITPEKSYIYVDGRYTLQAKEQAKGFEVIEFTGSPFADLEKHNLKSLGFEEKSILYSTYQKLPKCEHIGVSEDIDRLRMVKNEDEIKKMQVAADIADAAFSHILNFIKLGMTEIEIATELEFFMRKNGASGMSFDPIVALGERSALPHAFPTNRKVKNGEFLLMDFGCIYENYCSDMTRTVAIGNVPDTQREIYNIVLEAQINAENEVKPDVVCSGLDKIARDIITLKGFGGCFNHSLGHGVGLEIHEEPRVSSKSNQVLKKNNVLTIEPGIYVPDLCGVRIEDMVYVTEDGFKSFTNSSKELIVID